MPGSSFESLNAGLAGALNDQPRAEQARTLGIIGLQGRLGDELIAAVSSHPVFSEVHLVTVAPIEMGITRLHATRLDQLPRLTDFLIVVSSDSASFGTSFYGRDAAFQRAPENTMMQTLEAVLKTKPSRLAIVRATPALQQLGSMGQMLSTDYEQAAHRSKIESLLIFRPTPLVEKNSPQGLFKRLFEIYRLVNLFTMPKTLEPLTTAQLAQVILHGLIQAKPGLTVLPGAAIRERYEQLKQLTPV